MKSIMPDLHLTVPDHNTWTHADLLKISQLVRVFSALVEEKEQHKQQEQGQGQDDWLHVSVVSAVKQNVYKQLLDKANAAIGASNREINWSRVRVVRWPREVLFYSSSHWSREDLKVILRHIDSIDFEERESVAASVADADAGAAAGTAGTVLVDATAEAATVSATAESSLSLSAASATNDETIPFETRMRIINDLLDISDIVSDRVSTTRYIMWRKLKKHFPTLHLVSSESHRWCREDIRQLEALISTFKGAGMTGNKRMRNEDLPVSR